MISKANRIGSALLVAIVIGATLCIFSMAYAITNGQLDGDQHPYVGAANNGVNFCSGALISPTVFVTAVHCFFYPGEKVWVTFDSETDGPGPSQETMFSGTWWPHPEYGLPLYYEGE